MISGSEMKALKTVNKEHGRTTTRLICRQLGIDPSYASVLCTNLIKSEHLDRENRGCFRITIKGKKALRWPHDAGLPESKQATPFKEIRREEFQWQSFRAVGKNRNPTSSGFFKPGQDEVGWSAVSYGNTVRSRRAHPGGQNSLINEKAHPCGFCGGSGKEKGAKCPVCRGTGSINISPPAVSCAYCRGLGTGRRTGRFCIVCRGKGVVPVHPPIATCGQCRGSGAEQGNGLTCLKCGGKGVVHVRGIAQKGTQQPKQREQLNYGHGAFQG
jgi:hypothetical protein